MNPRWVSVLLGVGMVAALVLSQPTSAGSDGPDPDTTGVEASVEGVQLDIPDPFGLLFGSFFCGPLRTIQARVGDLDGFNAFFEELLAIFGCDDSPPPTPTTTVPGSTTAPPFTFTTLPGTPTTFPPTTIPLPPCSTSTSGTGVTVPCNAATTAPPPTLPPCSSTTTPPSTVPPTTFPPTTSPPNTNTTFPQPTTIGCTPG